MHLTLLLKRRVIISLPRPDPDYLLVLLLKAKEHKANIWERIYIGWVLLLSQRFRNALSDMEKSYPNESWTSLKWKLWLLPLTQLLLIACLSLTVIYSLSNKAVTWNIVEITRGHTGFVILPDSSLVNLNAGTYFKVSADYYKSPVIYLDGEGLFDLRSGTGREVTLKTNNAEIFARENILNVSAYGNELFVACLAGTALVKLKNGHKVSLNEGVSLTYNLDNKSWNTACVSKDSATSWVHGIYYLNHEKFGEICKQIERIYNVTIVFDRKTSMDYRFTGKFSKADSIHVILSTLSHAGSMQYFYDSSGVIHWR